jgi:hypothetical protein
MWPLPERLSCRFSVTRGSTAVVQHLFQRLNIRRTAALAPTAESALRREKRQATTWFVATHVPLSVKRIAEQKRASNVMVNANLCAAQPGEVFLGLIGADAIKAVRLLMVDPLHFKPLMRIWRTD